MILDSGDPKRVHLMGHDIYGTKVYRGCLAPVDRIDEMRHVIGVPIDEMRHVMGVQIAVGTLHNMGSLFFGQTLRNEWGTWTDELSSRP